MRKAPLLGLLLAVLAAPSFGAVFGHAWFDMNISELPASCDPGRVFMVKDGDSASDCSTGTGSDIHGCVCDSGGASYTALSAVAVAGGSDTEFQYNNGGSVIDGATGATYNDTSGLVTLQHQTDAASVEQLQIRGPDRATPAIGDEVFQSFYLEDAGGFEEQARITAALDVVTDAAEESSIRFDIQKAGTLTEAFIMGYDDTDGGTHLWGTSTYDGLLSQLGWASGEAGIGISQYVNADEVAVFTNGFPIIAIRGYDTYAVLRDDPGDFGWALLNQDPTSTTTTIAPDYDDANTGIGHAGTDQLSLIAGGFEVARVADTAPNLTFNATVDAASTEVVRVAGPDRATPADNDEAYISFNLEDSAAFDEFARISAVATDVTTTEEDGALTFDIVVAGGDAEAMRLVSDGTDGTQLILPSANDPVLPTLAFGDADSGLYEYTEDGISFAFSGAEVWAFNALSLGASTTACDVGGECVWLDTEVSTSTNPSIGPSVVDGETGIGWAGTGTLSMVLDAEEFARFSDPGDAASGEVFRLNGPDRTTPADDDEFHVSFNLEDSAAFDEFGRISAVALDVTTTEEDGALTFDVVAGATDTEVMRLAAAGTGQIVQLLVPAQNQEATPSIAFDDGDSGIYESQTDVLSVSLNGSQAWDFQGVGFYGVVSGSPGIQNEDATATNPTLLPTGGDADTGVGSGALDQMSMVVGGDEAWTFLEGAAGTSAGDSIAFVSDVVTVPSSNPTGGVYLYSEADTLYIRDTGGTVTDLTAGGFTPTDIDTDYGDETVTSTWQFNDTADNEWSPLTDDLTVGDDVDEGQIKIGNMVIGQADDTVSTTVLDDIGILYNNSDSIEDIGFMFVSAADIPRFVLAEEGADLATYNPRSMVIGPAATMANVDENIICSTNFDDIDCDTGATGADLGVEDDLELGGIIYGSAADGDTFSTALTFTTATADRTATVPNADSAMAQAVACGGTDKVSSFNVSTGAFTCTADQDSGGTPAWEALVNTADTPTDYTSDNTAEVVGFDFESAFTTGTQFLIRQQTGTPSGGTLFGITNNDADVTPFEIDVDGGGAEFTFDSGGHFVLPSVNDAATPTLAFGGDSGFYEIASNIVGISIGGTGKFQIFTNTISGLSNSSGALINETTSATNPTLLSRSGDLNTGLGSNAADQLSLIGNAHEMMRLGNDGTDTLVEIKADATQSGNIFEIENSVPTTLIQVDSSGVLASANTGEIRADNIDADNDGTPEIEHISGTTLRFNPSDDGTYEWQMNSGSITSSANAVEISNTIATGTSPNIRPDRSDNDSGIGQDVDDAVTIVAGADEAWTFAEGAYGTAAGDSVAFVSDVVTAPTSNPTGGVILYSDADTLYIRDTGGTVTDLGGAASGTDLNDIGDATAAGAVASAEWDQTWSWTSGTPTASGLEGFALDWTYPGTVSTDGGDQTLLKLELLDNGGDATGQIESLLTIDNQDSNDAALYGLRIAETQPWGASAILVPQENDATTPTIAFGNGDDGIYQPLDNSLAITLAGSQKWLFGTGELDAFATNGPRIRNVTGTNTTPSLNPRKGDPDTGIGGSADEVSIIAGGEEFQKVNDPGDTASGEVIRFAGPNRAGPVDDDEAYLSFFNEDSGSTSEEFSRISWIADDVTTTEEDGSLSFDVRVAGSLVEAMRLQGDGVDSTQVLFPQVGDAANPTVAFGDGDTGIYQSGDNSINFSTGGVTEAAITSNGIFVVNGGGMLISETPSATNPTAIPASTDFDSGLGQGTADTVTIVAGADEAWTFAEGAYGTAAGDSVAFVSDLVTAPSSNPTGGVLLYSDADSLYIRDSTGSVSDLAAAGAAAWEALTNTADTATSYTASATAETVTFDFESNFTTGTQFLVEQSAGTPSGGTLFGILDADTDVTPLQITGTASTILAQINNPTDAASSQSMIFAAPNRATPADDDEGYISFFNEESGLGSEEFSRISWIARDVTATEEDGALQFDVDSGGSLTQYLLLDGLNTGNAGVVLPNNSIGAAEIDTIVQSYPWLASGTFTDEADCNAPARVADVGGSGGPAMSTITCPLGGTNLDGDIYGNTLMPAEWNAGTVQLEIEVRIHDDPGATETMQGVFNAQCVSDEDVVSNSWTANTGLDVTFVSGDVQWDTQKVTSSTLTPDGSCAAGDSIYWRYVVCDTGTPPTTGCSASTHDVANTHIVGFRLIWTSNVS